MFRVFIADNYVTVKYKTRRGTDRGEIQKLRQEFFGKSCPRIVRQFFEIRSNNMTLRIKIKNLNDLRKF